MTAAQTADMSIILPGQQVTFRHAGVIPITGIINTVKILSRDAVFYEVSWWQDSDYKSAWFSSFEVDFAEDAEVNSGTAIRGLTHDSCPNCRLEIEE